MCNFEIRVEDTQHTFKAHIAIKTQVCRAILCVATVSPRRRACLALMSDLEILTSVSKNPEIRGVVWDPGLVIVFNDFSTNDETASM